MNIQKYRLETGGRCCICTGHTLRVHSPDGNTFLREMTPWTPVANFL